MKPLIRKDLKENLKLALIGLLIFSLILLQSYRSSVTALMSLLEGRNPGQNTVVQPLLVTNLLTAAIFFCSIFGAAVLGWLQTRNEAHTDLWAFFDSSPHHSHGDFPLQIHCRIVPLHFCHRIAAGHPRGGGARPRPRRRPL